MPKIRLDQLLVTRGLAPTRNRAQALIMAGKIYSGEQALTKPGQPVSEDIPLTVREKDHPWVSRGGIKLAHALEHFRIDVTGVTALDIGASTGGFTHVLLHRGAKKVYAVDVGHGQLAWELRNDARVTVLEKTNARHISAEQIPETVDFLCCDASFISLKTILPAPITLAAPGATLVSLIKPQFEVGKGKVGKGGVVRDPSQHQQVCDDIRNWFAAQYPEWKLLGITESPITGPEGNKEFLIALQR